MTTDPFLSYIENIQKKTGKTPQQITEMLRSEGVLKDGVKAGEIVSWLKEHLALGHGHAMAIVKWLRDHQEMV
ncbi:DUF4287 domain-containing protein [Ktedonobacter racemifer]|uniref:DUF4287 domain-containing protein n=1 Tax=Ktedonobacter racemifer DSM 44963 TaxID=485913 RepID=D6U3E6_KTERA|nr:DUF4287 domain-containing protein [Ktedonobacter racemifer]EFH81150.1 hypothetical protein Krac_1843 [Ktedonobacter racemifer DSM 44963]